MTHYGRAMFNLLQGFARGAEWPDALMAVMQHLIVCGDHSTAMTGNRPPQWAAADSAYPYFLQSSMIRPHSISLPSPHHSTSFIPSWSVHTVYLSHPHTIPPLSFPHDLSTQYIPLISTPFHLFHSFIICSHSISLPSPHHSTSFIPPCKRYHLTRAPQQRLLPASLTPLCQARRWR